MQVINVNFRQGVRVSEPLGYRIDFKTGRTSYETVEALAKPNTRKPRAKRSKKGAANV